MPQSSNLPGKFWWDGKVARTTYALTGLIGFAAKHNIDRYVARGYFPLERGLFNYWAPLGKAARLAHLSRLEEQFLFKLMLLALPFIFVGVILTVRRLRDAAQPLWLACLFFVPFVNLIFFLVLCVVPAKAGNDSVEASPWPHVRPLGSLIPRGALATATLTTVVTTAIGLVNLYIGAQVMGSYGWSLFVALPFCMGMFSVLLYSYHEPRELSSCLAVAALPIVILGAAIVGLAIEGIICVLMAAPIALALAIFGGFIGYFIQQQYWDTRARPAILSAILLMVPLSFAGKHAAALHPPELVVRSAIVINAAPPVVWKQVVAFTEIPAPLELLFRAGIAYPIRAEISGSGVGATRMCIFSTGAFEEPITVWDEAHLLKFSVEKNPPPLDEISPYGHIHPPHLQGYFISHGGQFLLSALPDGRTRLEGTTWYQDTMWPATYWSWWSDYVIHRIHMRVLTHIRQQAEAHAR